VVSVLRALVAYPVIALSTLIFGGIAIIGSRLPPRWQVPDRAATVWARIFLVMAGLRFEVEGREHLRPERPQVVVSNHLSNLDPMLCWVALQPIHCRFMAKKEVFKIPFFRTVIQAMHMVKVDREAGAGGYEYINQQIREVFDLGFSLLIYGEGTRSRTHDVKEFKKGPFIIANAVDAPILPVTITGTDQAWPPGDWRMYGGKARVVIHPMVEQSGTPTEMRSQIETLIRSSYEDLSGGA
jgi:1-acyl-sn-glycerol-3-phosphate acyltransferase